MFIDSNIFLEIALKDENFKKCENFIKNLINKKINFYTSDFIIYSCLLIIYNKSSKLNMKNFLVFINSIKITVIKPTLKEIYGSIDIMDRYNLDFDDALVVSCMAENKIKDLVTYDKHFNKVKEINIIKP